MKRLTYLLFFVLLAVTAQAQRAKYVFFFIGDGMGLNQVNTTEMYLGEQEGRIGTLPLTFASFPVAGMATTFSATNSITDSAAGGTALATGSKTYNGAIGVNADRETVMSVAERAKRSGKKVGVTTSVSVDHATPASFYAHRVDRNMYYEIAQDMLKADFDFYAGGGFLKPNTTFDGKEAPSIFPQIEEAGYTLARGVDEYKAKCDDADKMVLIQKEGADPSCLPYAIDRKEGDLTLKQITESAIDFLTKDNNKGFFLMVEGGKIDWACHNNDVATAVQEVLDLDEAVKVAYEFYQKHPKETLIVITADHETGGLGMGYDGYTLALKSVANQETSQEELSRAITDLRKAKDHKATWEEVKACLAGRQDGFLGRAAPQLGAGTPAARCLPGIVRREPCGVCRDALFLHRAVGRCRPQGDEPVGLGGLDVGRPHSRVCACLCHRCRLEGFLRQDGQHGHPQAHRQGCRL